MTLTLSREKPQEAPKTGYIDPVRRQPMANLMGGKKSIANVHEPTIISVFRFPIYDFWI